MSLAAGCAVVATASPVSTEAPAPTIPPTAKPLATHTLGLEELSIAPATTLAPTPEAGTAEPDLESAILVLGNLPESPLIAPEDASALQRIGRFPGRIEFSENMKYAKWVTDGLVYILDLAQQSVILTFPNNPYPDETVSTFSPDGERLAWEPGDGTVRVLALTGKGQDLKFDGVSPECCLALTFSPDGRMLLVADPGDLHPGIRSATVLRLLDLQAEKEVYAWDWNPQIAFSPDGRTLGLWPTVQPGVILWDVGRLEEQRTIEGYMTAAPYYVVDFAPDWRSVAFWDRAGGELYDVSTGRKRFAFDGEAVGFTPDGRTMATVETGWTNSLCTDNVCLYDLQTGEIRAVLSHEHASNKVEFSPAGRLLATLDRRFDPKGGTRVWPRLWDVERATEIVGAYRDLTDVFAVDFSPDGRFLLVTLSAIDSGRYDVELWAVPPSTLPA